MMPKFDKDYIRLLIDTLTEESSILEYKAAAALDNNDKNKGEISKDVSSFANAGGGVILYGVRECPKPNNHKPEAIDPIDRKQVSKEWLDQVIHSRIKPPIKNLRIHPVTIDEEKDHVVYVVEIEQSNTAHQAYDHKYYRRRNFTCDPMEDYEIRETMNRSQSPDIQLEFKVITRTIYVQPPADYPADKPFDNPRSERYLKIYAQNVGPVLAKYVNGKITIPAKCLEGLYINSHPQEKKDFSFENTVSDLLYHDQSNLEPKPIFGPSRHRPILPQTSIEINCNIPDLHLDFDDPEHEVSWIVHADNAKPQEGKVRCMDIKKVPEHKL